MRNMLRFLKGYEKESILAPLFKMLEACFELLVPLVVANIIDVGIKNGDLAYIGKQCGLMVLLAVVGMASSLTAQYFAAKAALGYGTALRGALFGTMVAAFFVGYIGCMDLVSMVPLTAPMLFILIPLLIVSIVFMVQTNHFMEHFAERHTRRLLQSRFFQNHRRKRRKATHKDRHAARRTRRRTEQPSRVRDGKRA